MNNTPPRALVVGLGIAGMSAAIGLRDAGWEPVVVERAPARRSGGYFVGLFPDGKQAARELDVLDTLHTRNPEGNTEWQVEADGSQQPGIGFLDQPGEPYAVMRGDIEAALWDRLQGAGATRHGQSPVEIRFHTRPVEIVDRGDDVLVMLEDIASETTSKEQFDLVVGTDGLRSTVRRLVFGPPEAYMRSWDAIICAFELDEQVPGYDERDGIILALPRRSAWVFPFADRKPTVLLTYRTKAIDAQFTQSPSDRLEAEFADLRSHPIVDHGLRTIAKSSQNLFDSVHSVHMPTWSKGRVVLLGDSAWCLTLFSGMGSTAGLRGGAVLSRSLRAHPTDVRAALESFERDMRPFITASLRRARILQHMFVPTGTVSARVRKTAMSLMGRSQQRKERRAKTASLPQEKRLAGSARAGY